MNGDLPQILITALTLIFSAGAWNFYQARMKLKHNERKDEKDEKTLFRDDLRERVAKLEQLLDQAQEEKEAIQEKLTNVLQDLAAYRVRLEFLEKENERLRHR